MSTGLDVNREAFFLPATRGNLLVLHTYPASGGAVSEALLHVPAFAEEMNKSRRTVALAAAELARRRIASIVIDLFGCGDSAGDFADARLEIWLDDLALAHRWLEQRHACPVGLWGLRLGCLIASRLAAEGNLTPCRLMFWQAMTKGETAITEFLRLKVAAGMIGSSTQGGASTKALKAQLRDGEALEVAGYELSPALASSLSDLTLTEDAPPHCPMHWFEVIREEGRTLLPGSRRILDAWVAAGADITTTLLPGEPFWRTLETAQCESLIEASVTSFGPPSPPPSAPGLARV